MRPRTPHSRGKLLRERITAFLVRSRKTPGGRITPYPEEVVLGTPVGPHTPLVVTWLYQEHDTGPCMLFGFYSGRNDNGHDIICKALPRIEDYVEKMGASLQLNAALNLQDDGDDVRVTHHGLVSRPRRIKRETLVELILRFAPKPARALGPAFPPEHWPFVIGTTGNLPLFLDRLYLYVACIQAAKDAHGTHPSTAAQDAQSDTLADEAFDGQYSAGFTGKRRPYSLSGTIEVESRHNFVVDALHNALTRALPGTYAVGATQQVDLYVARKHRPLAIFEVKTDTELSNIYAAIGQLQYHGSDADIRCIVLPNPSSGLVKRLSDLGLHVLAYQWKKPTQPAFVDLSSLLETLRHA